MKWTESVELELQRAREAQRQANSGKVRTSARRAAGLALEELQRRFPERNFGGDFITRLRSLAVDPAVPQPVREAADRLQARLTPDFASRSVDPVDDAEIILAYIVSLLH
jgi:hypothetical protein